MNLYLSINLYSYLFLRYDMFSFDIDAVLTLQ